MDKDRQRAKEQTKALPFKEKISNFWFYYKIHTIVLVISVFVLAWSAVQCANRIEYDLTVSFYTSYYISDENLVLLDEFLKANVDDANKNGSVDAKVMFYVADIDGEYLDQNGQAMLMKLQAELASGEADAYMVNASFKTYMEKVLDGTGMIEKVIDISDSAIVKDALNIPEGEKLYWISLMEYEKQKDKPEAIAKRKNVKIIEEIFEQSLKDQ